MSMEKEIKIFIEDYIRPRVQSDGGEIRFISYCDNLVTIKLQGECSRCPVTNSCFSEWLEKEFRKSFGENISIKKIIEKPYFWNA